MLSVHVRRNGLHASYYFPWVISIVAFMANPPFLRGERVKETLETLARDPYFDMVEINPPKGPELWREIEEVAEDTGIMLAIGAQPLVLMEKKNPSSGQLS